MRRELPELCERRLPFRCITSCPFSAGHISSLRESIRQNWFSTSGCACRLDLQWAPPSKRAERCPYSSQRGGNLVVGFPGVLCGEKSKRITTKNHMGNTKRTRVGHERAKRSCAGGNHFPPFEHREGWGSRLSGHAQGGAALFTLPVRQGIIKHDHITFVLIGKSDAAEVLYVCKCWL